MGLLIFAVVLFIVVFVALGFREDESCGDITWKLGFRQLFAFLTLLVLIPGFITKVGAVEEGILYDPFNGGVQEETLDEGYHLKSIFAKAYTLSKAQKSVSYEFITDDDGEFVGDGDSFSVQTKNGEFAMYSVELKFVVENSSIVYNTWKKVPTASNLSQYTQTAIKGTAINYDIYELLSQAFELSRIAAEDVLRETLAEFGIHLVSLNYKDIYAGSEIENAILRQGTSAKEEQINVNLQNAAIIAAETARITAAGIALAAIEAADGRAQAVQLEADAEAYALETVANAQQELLNLLGLTPDQYIEYIKWSTWDGVLPTTMLGDVDVIIPID